MFKRNKKDKDSLDKKEKKEKNEAAEQEKKRLDRFLGGRRGTATSPAASPTSSSGSTPTGASLSAAARVTAISSPAASSNATATRKPSFSAMSPSTSSSSTSSSGTIRTAAGASTAAGGASPSAQAAAGHTWNSPAHNSSPDRSSGGDQAPVPNRPRTNPMGTTAHATPSPHGSIPVPPRPTGTGGAGQILSAAYSTRSNVPVLRVPMAATPAVASASRPHTTVSAPGAAVPEPATAAMQQTPHAAGEEVPAGRERSSSSGSIWQQPRSATVTQPLAPSSLATASPTPGLVPPEADGRNRAASMSASFVPGVAPSGVGQARENRRKSLLAPMKPEQVKAALSNDEFSYFDEDEKGT